MGGYINLESLGRWFKEILGIKEDKKEGDPISLVQDCSDDLSGFGVVCENEWKEDGRCKAYCVVVHQLHQLETMGSSEWTFGMNTATEHERKPCASTCYRDCSLCIDSESHPIKCKGSGQRDCPSGFRCSTKPILPKKHRRAMGIMHGRCVYDSALVDEFSLKITDNDAFLPSGISPIILMAIVMLIMCFGMLFSCRKRRDKLTNIQDSSYILMNDE